MVVLLSSAAALSSHALGQDSANADEATSKIERIEVTGSHIKRTEVEGVSPILMIDRDQIEKSGFSTVSELMQNLSISSQGAYSASVVSDVRGTVTNVNLRGLGAENTLVLLDGRRLPDEAGLGVVDLSTIPMAAVERIEVLKDSASAIYGSDATGGVINIITRKDLNGSALYARGSTPHGLDGATETEFSYLTGANQDNFRLLTSITYRHVEPIYHRDRDWTKVGLSFYAYPGNYASTSKGAKITAHDNCQSPESERITAEEDGNLLCSYNYGATMAFSPEVTQIGFMNNIEYNLSDDLTLFSTIRASKQTNIWNMAPNAGKFTMPQAIALAKKESLGLKGEIDSDVNIYYRGVPWGLRQWEEENTLIGGNIGLNGSIGSDWGWNFVVGHTQSKKDTINPGGFMLISELVSSIEAGEFNPFETQLSDSSLAVVNRSRYEPFQVIDTQMSTYQTTFSGDLMELGGGMAGLAVGVSRSEQSYKKVIDPQSEAGNVFGVTEDQGAEGDREQSAAFFEIALPVTSQLEFQLAARHDVYNDFGSTTNPKFGFKYLPTESILFRGNVGTGFKAPTLSEIYKGTQIGLENLYDTPDCGSGCTERTTEIEIQTSGNPNLTEETSLSYNFGVVTEPISGLSIGADYWYIKIEDIVAEMDPQDVLDAIAAGRNFDGVEIQRVGGEGGRLERIKLPVMNLGTSEDAGVDTNIAYRFNAGSSRFFLNADYSRKIYARSVPFPGQPQQDTLYERGEPRWRSTAAGTWGFGAHAVTLRNNRIGEQKSEGQGLKIGAFSTYDLQYAWNHPWGGQLALGALNVLDTDFPADDSERAGDDTRVVELYNPNGRVLYMNINQTF